MRVHMRGSIRQRGQGMVEYALLLMLVAAVVVAGLTILGGRTAGLYSNVNAGLQLKSPAAKASATPKPTPTPTKSKKSKGQKTPKPPKTPKPHKTHGRRGRGG